MASRLDQHKQLRTRNVAKDGRDRRVATNENARKLQREQNFASRRNIQEMLTTSENEESAALDDNELPQQKAHKNRKELFAAWKKDKEKKKLQQNRQVRPPFKITTAIDHQKEDKKLFEVIPAVKNLFLENKPVFFTFQGKNIQRSASSKNCKNVQRKPSNTPKTAHQYSATNKVNTRNLRSRATSVNIHGLKTERMEEMENTPVQAENEGNPLGKISNKPIKVEVESTKPVKVEPVVVKDATNSENVERCSDFRQLLNSTISRLENLCQMWEKEEETQRDVFTEMAREQLLLATGMARLIIREKFAQFRGLIESCENQSNEFKTTCDDLQGFWDMIAIQVEDIDKKFNTLQVLKDNNWVPVKVDKPLPKKKAIQPKPAAALKARSNFKSFLATSRKQMKQAAASSEDDIPRSKRRSSMKSPASTLRRSNSSFRSNDFPNTAAILSATRVAKVVGRKSYQDDTALQTPLKDIHKENKVLSSKCKAFSSILKSGPSTPAVSKKTVVFDLSSSKDNPPMPIIKHTYSHVTTPPKSPRKDLFDELLEATRNSGSSYLDIKGSSTSLVSSTESVYLSAEASPDNDSWNDEVDIPNIFCKPPTPYRTVKKRADVSSTTPTNETCLLNVTPIKKGRRSGRKNPLDLLCASPVSEPLSNVRRSARLSALSHNVTLTNNSPDAGCIGCTESNTFDLISFESPGVQRCTRKACKK